MRQYIGRRVNRLGTLLGLAGLAWNASAAVLGVVWSWPLWWATTISNLLVCAWGFWLLRHRAEDQTIDLLVVIRTNEEEP